VCVLDCGRLVGQRGLVLLRAVRCGRISRQQGMGVQRVWVGAQLMELSACGDSLKVSYNDLGVRGLRPPSTVKSNLVRRWCPGGSWYPIVTYVGVVLPLTLSVKSLLHLLTTTPHIQHNTSSPPSTSRSQRYHQVHTGPAKTGPHATRQP